MAGELPDLDTPEGLREAVAKLDPDFQGLLERKGVPAKSQGMLSNLGVPSISKFAALAESAGDVRTFAVDHCQLVRGRDGVSIASLVDSWQACTTRMQVRHKAEAEASLASLPAPVNKVEAQDLKVRFEQMYYKMGRQSVASYGNPGASLGPGGGRRMEKHGAGAVSVKG